ncbi:MAG: lysophospholipid acyltransferase family protein, partial [Chitinophagaceae bacterium]|nr:lysophospholipid acyltransferase family protein [Chitinophagaceae bacterium]
IVYTILFAISLLPLRMLFILSDVAYIVIYHLIGYRKNIVMNNLAIAFPDKTISERKSIAKQFYHNLTDTFIETIKMISIGPKELARRGNCDLTLINDLLSKGKNIHILVGHQFNWEFANLMYAKQVNAPFIGIYKPISNKVIGRIFLRSRSRFGSILVATDSFKHKMHHLMQKQYVLALAADQNPGIPKQAFWLRYFGKPAPFITGPGKLSMMKNTAVVFVSFTKTGRGHYSFKTTLLAENSRDHTSEEITMLYRTQLEKEIRQAPSNYLWSHRRWRHEWKEGYRAVL